MTDKLKNRVESKILECLEIALELCPGLDIPEIKYNMKGLSAGECQIGIKTGKCILRFNLDFLKDYTEHFINVTIPHEVAHYVTYVSCGRRVLPHGPEWETWMKLFGVEYPQVTHSYQTLRKSKIRPWLYKCRCREYFFTNQQHRKAQGGRNYRCKLCNNSVVFVN